MIIYIYIYLYIHTYTCSVKLCFFPFILWFFFSATTRTPQADPTRGSSPRREQQLLHPGSNSSVQAGRLTLHYHNWVSITSNSFVLSVIKFGLRLHFHTPPPFITLPSSPFSPSRSLSISSGVTSLHSKSAIAVIDPHPLQVVSNIFDVPKKDSDEGRVILNLKFLNKFIYKSRFRLEGYEIIISMLRPNDFMCSVDLKDAFLMYSVHPDFYCFLCFDWEGVRYCFTSMPFGLTSAPRIFTKVLKVVLVFFRGRGLRVTAWFDDLIIMADSVNLLLEHLYFVRLTLRSLGFLLNDKKSSLIPSQSMLHLGFLWDTVSFSLSVPEDKVKGLKALCSQALSGPVSLRFLQRILGTIESFRLAFPFSALHYRNLQQQVSCEISSGSRWDKKVSLSPLSRVDMEWWISCPLSLLPRSLAPFSHDLTVTSDSSSTGWGAFSSSGEEVYGFWSTEESSLHINILETKAVLFAFRSLFRDISNSSILIKSDNITTVCYINHLGGVKSPEISDLICELYDFCLSRKISIRASYLKGCLNVRADALSRRTRDHSYAIPLSLFSHLCDIFHINPEIDLFASRHNAKLDSYYSYGPDPQAIGFDAFSQDWPQIIYAFPPIMLVGKFLSYFMSFSNIEGLIIVPFWPAQPFYSVLLNLLIKVPVFFSASHLEESAVAPRQLRRLLACIISSSSERQKAFQQSLLENSSDQSHLRPSHHTADTGAALSIGSVKGKTVMALSL